MKDKFLNMINIFSRAVIQPVMFMSVMGMMIALAVILQIDFMPGYIKSIGSILRGAMDGMLSNLSILFCVGIAAAMAKTKKADAAILALITFLMFLGSNHIFLEANHMIAEKGLVGFYGTGQTMVLGYQVTDMSVFIGMMLGCLVGFVHNKFSNVEFPDIIRAFGGSRLSFMILIPLTVVVAILAAYIWPIVNEWITASTEFMKNAGSAGVFAYAFGNRFLIPTGLHHMLWVPFCYTPFGGSALFDGQVYSGASNIFYAEMAHAATLTEIDPSVRFSTFGFAKVFGSIGIVLAFIRTAKKQNRKMVEGMVLPPLFVAIMAGITEPLDFMYLFISPLLWLVNSLLTGCFETLLWVLGSRTIMGGGLIDLITTNSVISPQLTKIHIFLIVGVCSIFVWYFVFSFFIRKFDIQTPGREVDRMIKTDESESVMPNQKEAIESLIEGLGGRNNITSLENCFTRLRIELKDETKLNRDMINQFPNKGIIAKNATVQIIIGMKVQTVREEICAFLDME